MISVDDIPACILISACRARQEKFASATTALVLIFETDNSPDFDIWYVMIFMLGIINN